MHADDTQPLNVVRYLIEPFSEHGTIIDEVTDVGDSLSQLELLGLAVFRAYHSMTADYRLRGEKYGEVTVSGYDAEGKLAILFSVAPLAGYLMR